MIRHMVLFNLKPEVPPSDRDRLFARIHSMGNIPALRRIETGTLLDPAEASYRNHMSSDFQYALLADFDDEAGLYAYQKDALHVEVAKEIRERVSQIKVIDFVTAG